MSNIIPFGKHKGRQLAEVAVADPQYLEWLVQQAWFVEKFKPMYQLIKAGIQAQDVETPEHNAMQARFLDEKYRRSVAIATWFPTSKDHQYATEAVEWLRKRRMSKAKDELTTVVGTYSDGWGHSSAELPVRQARQRMKTNRQLRRQVETRLSQDDSDRFGREIDRGSLNQAKEQRVKIIAAYIAYRKARASLAAWAPNMICRVVVGEPKFESPTDVSFTARRQADFDDGGVAASRDLLMFVEIKSSLGDDYPAVLRQVFAQRERVGKIMSGTCDHRWIVLVGEFAANGATLDQAKAIMWQSRIILVLESEVDTASSRASDGV